MQVGDRIAAGVVRRAVARFALTTMELGVMLARSYHDIAPVDAAVGRFRDYLERPGARAHARIVRSLRIAISSSTLLDCGDAAPH